MALPALSLAADIAPPKEAPAGKPIVLDADQRGQRIKVSRFLFRATDVKIGIRQNSPFCGNADELRLTDGAAKAVLATVAAPTRNDLEAAGYSLAGDEVHALGSPLGEALSGSVTRSVVSSWREDMKLRCRRPWVRRCRHQFLRANW